MRPLLRLGIGVLITVTACASTTENTSGDQRVPAATSTTTSSSTTSSSTTSTTSSTTTAALSTTPPSEEAQAPTTSAGCWSSPVDPSSGPLSFEDATAELGLVDPLLGIRGHAAGWGDVNQDGWPDLFVGTFADRPDQDYRMRGAPGPSPDRFLWGGPNGFSLDESFPELRGRASGAVFADLDSDGRQELVVARNEGNGDTPGTIILDYDGERWDQIELPIAMGARAVGVLDADGDGHLDLFVTEDRWSGGSSRLLGNRGDLEFVDVTKQAGLPLDVHGLGVATADLDGDRRPDIFVSGSNRLFVSRGAKFREVSSRVFEWDFFGEEDDVGGVAVADLNRDRRLDLVLGQHFNSTIDDDRKVAVRIYLNESEDGELDFTDVTEQAGLIALPTKAPHVEIVDIDNDGWPDIVTSASAKEGTRPATFMHRGLEHGVPSFQAPSGLGSEQYWVTGGSSDVDRDGRQDVFLVEWEPSLPSLLLLNNTEGGHWLSVGAADREWGPGTIVDIYEEGTAGDAGSLLGSREIMLSTGYAAGIRPVAHFGLGDRNAVDVVITSPSGDTHRLESAQADQHIELGVCP